MGWLEGPMTYVWLAYLSSAELLSLIPSQAPSCILISEEAQTKDYSGDYACASLHEAVFRSVRAIWLHAGHDQVIAFGTMLIALFTFVLYRSTEKLWQATKDVAKSQADDTRILQRAYVSVRPRGVTLFVSGNAYSCDVSFDNVGNLPARTLNWFIDRQFSDDRFLKTFPIKEKNFEGNVVVAPGTKMKKGGMRIDNEDFTVALSRQGQKWLYVWGEVRYDDGFGGARFTKFCHRYNLAAYFMNVQGGGIHEEHARYHIYGNDAD